MLAVEDRYLNITSGAVCVLQPSDWQTACRKRRLTKYRLLVKHPKTAKLRRRNICVYPEKMSIPNIVFEGGPKT